MVAFLLSFTITYAQYLIKDTTILRLPDNSQQLIIGIPDNDGSVCYEWSGDNILSDIHQAVITINPLGSDNIYNSTRTSQCGVESGRVTVHVVDEITIESVTPKRECYSAGDQVDVEDFIIQTYPPGYASWVTVSPTSVTNNWWGNTETQTLTFSVTYNNHTSNYEVSIDVLNDGLAPSVEVSAPFGDLVKKIKTVENVLEKSKKKINKIKTFLKMSPAISCEPEVDVNISIPVCQTIRSCCEGKIVEGYTTHWPSISGSAGISCDVPTPYSIPKVGGVFIVFGFSAGVELNLGTIKYISEECSDVVVPISVGGQLFGGARVGAAEKDWLNITLQLVGSASTSWEWHISQGIDWHPLDIELSIEVVGTLCSLDVLNFSYTFGSIQLFND